MYILYIVYVELYVNLMKFWHESEEDQWCLLFHKFENTHLGTASSSFCILSWRRSSPSLCHCWRWTVVAPIKREAPQEPHSIKQTTSAHPRPTTSRFGERTLVGGSPSTSESDVSFFSKQQYDVWNHQPNNHEASTVFPPQNVRPPPASSPGRNDVQVRGKHSPAEIGNHSPGNQATRIGSH